MLGKQVWRLLQHPDSLCARVIKAKYFAQSSTLNASMGSRPSAIWRSLASVIEDVKKGIIWRVGNGNHIDMWNDVWVDKHKIIKPDVYSNNPDPSQKVNHFLLENPRRWDIDRLSRNCNHNDSCVILKVPLSNRDVEDRPTWIHESNGDFTVRSAYKEWLQQHELNSSAGTSNQQQNSLNGFWKMLWKLQLPPKIKHFGWRLSKNFLPTDYNLFSRRIAPDAICKRCGQEEETIEHALWKCN